LTGGFKSLLIVTLGGFYMTNFRYSVFIIASGTLLGGCASINQQQAADLDKTVSSANATFSSSLDTAQSLQIADNTHRLAEMPTKAEPDPRELQPELSSDLKNHLVAHFTLLSQYSTDLAKLTGNQTDFAMGMSGFNGAMSKDLSDANALSGTIGGVSLLTSTQAQSMQKDVSTLSGAVSVLGEAIIKTYSEDKAYEVASKYDPAIASYCADLQSLICRDPDDPHRAGLTAVIWHGYDTALNDTWRDLHDLHPDATSVIEQRQVLLTQYNSLLNGQKADVAKLLALREALGHIAQAHHELVAKHRDSFFSEIQMAYADVNGLVSNYKTGSTAK
jgi:hypothetical protein